ncbi:MAG: galactose-1-phosphate uridylyltransferase [Candidatus Bipolaricaulota bacterium]|nr:galactose-1-phosphate uridylyltransferase [Candidatus Bipolaricaulota bacterium]
MPELRRGPIAGRWVIVAPERAKRPSDFLTSDDQKNGQLPDNCPFCAGNEDKTPPEIYRASRNDGSWQVRVVPNKFPALNNYPELERTTVNGLYERMNGVGTHEVIIESPKHEKWIPDLPLQSVETIIDTFVVRLRELKKNNWYRYILLFENHGKRAGASLSHPHSQIIATPIVPQLVHNELQRARAYYNEKGTCLFCDLLVVELRAGERIIEETDQYVTYTPYASRFPFEITIMPKKHAHDFANLDEVQQREFARILKHTLYRLKQLLGDPPYNLVLHNAPNPIQRPEKPGHWATLQHDYHWRVSIIPRLTTIAGFEWGTGFYINPVPPEDAAHYLKEVEVPE